VAAAAEIKPFAAHPAAAPAPARQHVVASCVRAKSLGYKNQPAWAWRFRVSAAGVCCVNAAGQRSKKIVET
jgi:hypothetical protein